MAKIKLYIASTLDGFIARENGSLDWLMELPNPNLIDHGYMDFLKEIDVLIMGRKTYEDVISFGIEWPYSDNKTYIITKDDNFQVKSANTFILNDINQEIILRLKSESKKNIWLVGGGNMIVQFLNENSVDEMIISVIPIVLGKGIRLFQDNIKEQKYQFIKSESFETGVVNLAYSV